MDCSKRARSYLRREHHYLKTYLGKWYFFLEPMTYCFFFQFADCVWSLLKSDHSEPVLQDSKTVFQWWWANGNILQYSQEIHRFYGWNRPSKSIFKSMVLFHTKLLNCPHEKETFPPKVSLVPFTLIFLAIETCINSLWNSQVP